MKRIITVLLLFIGVASYAQTLALTEATKQMINSGASPTSIINYTIEVGKYKKCKISIDSVVDVYTQKSIPFNLFKERIDSAHQAVSAVGIIEKGVYELRFSTMKVRGSGRPGAPPMNLTVPIADFTQGAIVYYRIGQKKKKLTVESFEELQTINAP